MFNKETGKRHFLTHDNGYKEKKSFINSNNLVDSNCHWKHSVEWISIKQEKKLQPQKTYILRKKDPKIRKTFTLKVRLSPSKKCFN